MSLLTVALLWPFARPAAAVEVGMKAPAFSLKDTKGRTMALASLKGKVVVVNFWASWCRPCLRELPHFQALHDRVQRDGAEVVSISIDVDTGKARAIAHQLGLTLPVLHDPEGKAASAYEPPKIPSTYVVGVGGVVQRVVSGVIPADRMKAFEASLRKLLRPRSSSHASTQQSVP